LIEGVIRTTAVAYRTATLLIFGAIDIAFADLWGAVVLVQVNRPITCASKIKVLVIFVSSSYYGIVHPRNPLDIIVHCYI
jgi:hypothetical protein